MTPEDRIRRRVLRAIALNRTPGLHFPGNFIELSFDQVASGDTRVSYETGPHCVDAHGGAQANVVHHGRRVSVIRTELTRSDGRVCSS